MEIYSIMSIIANLWCDIFSCQSNDDQENLLEMIVPFFLFLPPGKNVRKKQTFVPRSTWCNQRFDRS